MVSAYPSVPATLDDVAALEALYQPYAGFADWRHVRVDQPRWHRYSRSLAARRQAADQRAREHAQDVLVRAAALESGALDGLFPANPELTSAVLAASVGSKAEPETAIDLVAECHRRALVLAAEAAADGRFLDIGLIAVLQDVITESQTSYTVTTERGLDVEVELPRRQYKPVSNYLKLPAGGLAVFAPAGLVAAEMERLVSELGSEPFNRAHPVLQAAYAHYALTAIHPFADGNGRLARTVASLFLMREAGVPLLVFADQWPAYYQALGAATQDRDAQALADHVAVCGMAAMDLAANLLTAGDVQAATRLREGGSRPARRAPRPVLDDGARELLEALAVELREMLVSPPRGLQVAVADIRHPPADLDEGAYSVAEDPATGRCGIRMAIRRDARAAVDLEFVALLSDLPGDLMPLAVREVRSSELLEVSIGDAYPLVLTGTALRIRLWAERLVTTAISSVAPRPASRARAGQAR